MRRPLRWSIAGRLAAKVMCRRVLWGIGLGLHDAASELCAGQLADDDLANEEFRQGDGIDWQIDAAEVTDCEFGDARGLRDWLGRR